MGTAARVAALAAPVLVAIWAGVSAAPGDEADETCVSGQNRYVKDTEPACCHGGTHSSMDQLAQRSASASSVDSLIESLANPSHFSGGSVASRPLFEPQQKLFLKLYVRRLSAVDQKKKEYALLFDMYWQWRDCRLLFKDNVGPIDINHKHPHFDDFWYPHPHFLEEDHNAAASLAGASLLLFPDGMVMGRASMSRHFHCVFDFSKMPFDQHDCSITISLPSFSSDLVQLEWDPDPLVLETLSNVEWFISPEADWKASLKKSSYSTHEPGPDRDISSLSLNFKLTRKSRDFMTQFVLPASVYWLCSYGGLFVDHAAVPGRVALGLIPVLTLNNKMDALRAKLPPMNESTRLQSFMLAAFMLTILQLVEFCIVNYAATLVKKANSSGFDWDTAVVPLDSTEALSILKFRGPAFRRRIMIWARWTHENLDFFSRWVFAFLFFVCWFGTLQPWSQ